MLGEAIGGLLPTAAAVALSPIPIVAIVLVLDSQRGRINGLLFALGWVAGLAALSTVLVVLSHAGDPDDVATGTNWLQVGLGLFLLALARRQWKKRPKRGEEPEMPAWMATVESISAARALGLGVALSAANPKNLALVVAAAASIAGADLTTAEEAIAIAAFVAIGSITVVGAVAAFLVAPRRAERPLAAIRRFMADNNATILLVIFLLLGLKLVGDGLGGL